MTEAICEKCGETFIPDGPDDLEHLETIDGTECGGTGRPVRDIQLSDAPSAN